MDYKIAALVQKLQQFCHIGTILPTGAASSSYVSYCVPIYVESDSVVPVDDKN